MRSLEWKKWLLSMSSGATLFQTAGCIETSAGLITLFSGLTAGGVLYLVARIIRD